MDLKLIRKKEEKETNKSQEGWRREKEGRKAIGVF